MGAETEPVVEQAFPIEDMEDPVNELAEQEPEVGSSQIDLTDAGGNNLRFDEPPERIVVAGKAGQLILHSAYLFPEAIDRVVAMEQRLQRDISMLPLVDPGLDEKIQLERDAAAEQIAPAQPDVVLMKTYMAEDLGEPLGQLGIPVVYFDLETPEQFTRDIQVLGALLGNPERGEQVLSFYQDRLDQIESSLDGLVPEDRPGVLLIQHDTRGGEVAFKVPSREWLQTIMVELAGGDPIWMEAAEGGGWTVVNFEQIAAWNPEIIILVDYFGDPGEAASELRQDEKWRALQAVKDEKMFAFPGDFLSWDQPDPRWVLGLEWLGTVIHPERFGSLDMLEEIKNFYAEMYGLDAEQIEDEVLPLITGDIDV
jgi:iron complex transport system substrate-binding protein